MFIPQRYMTLTVGNDKIKLSKMVFNIEEDSFETFTNNHNLVGMIRFFEKYRNNTVIIVENDERSISIFQELIDDGEPVPGYVMMFDDHIMFLATSRGIAQGIKRIGNEPSIQEQTNDDNIIKLPDIRKLLERV